MASPGLISTDRRILAVANQRRWLWMGKITLAVAVLWAFKRLAHTLQLDVLRIGVPFIALVLATLVLLTLLLLGVLSDFKESEHLPAELATLLELQSLNLEVLHLQDSSPATVLPQQALLALAEAIPQRLMGRISEPELYSCYHACYRHTAAMAHQLERSPALQARLLQPLEGILGILNRIEVIRSTGFVTSVYWLAYLGTGLTCVGLVFSRLDPPLESGLFLFVVSFLLLFLIHLIQDLDNPFGYSDSDSAEDVSLEALHRCLERMRQPATPQPS